MLNDRNLLAGLFYLCFGGIFALMALHYPVGTAGRMGPGFFPLTIGLTLCVLGAVLVLGALRKPAPEPLPEMRLPALAYILLGVVAFGLTIERGGLLIATLLLVGISSLADRDRRWLSSLISALVLAIVMGWLVFGKILGLPLTLFPVDLIQGLP